VVDTDKMEPNRISELLKQKIVWLDLAPETVLNLSELANEWGVSRTPIKESLISLQAQGWVVRQGSHFTVTPLSLNRIREVTEIRTVMEMQAYIWAFHRITPEDLTALQAIKTEMMNLKADISNKEMIELDFKFHALLYAATGNQTLSQMLEGLLSHYLRFWLSIVVEIDPHAFFADTLDIITGIEKKDEDMVKEASFTHIQRSVNEIRALF
jgi:DNA-binding GntR family transcriptional regulator